MELTRQQICVALGVSESTIRRLESEGMPFEAVGVRKKRYSLEACKTWLRQNPPQSRQKKSSPG